MFSRHFILVLALGSALPCSILQAGIKAIPPETPEKSEIRPDKSAAPRSPRAAKPRPAQTATKPKSHLPTVNVGDTAVYQFTNLRTGKKMSYTSVVTDVADDKIVLRTGSSISHTYTREWNWLETKHDGSVDSLAMPAVPDYRFPLKVGDSWDARYTTRTRGGDRKHEHQRKITVEAMEKVIVPAGTFEAYRLRSEGHFSSREGSKMWTGQMHKTYWYAPAVSRLVKSELEETGASGITRSERTELTSFNAD